jgi:uncharacterized membrane protein
MGLLIAGVAVFIGAHLIPSIPSLRNGLRQRLGAGPYMGLFSLVAIAGFILLIVGMGRAPAVHVWNPPSWGKEVAIYAMPIALTLFIGAYMPSNLKRITRHPMLWGVTIWAAVHLLSNGDLASLILFGSFGLYSLFDMGSANHRGAQLSKKGVPYWHDALLLVTGGIVYVALRYWHGWLFGMPVAFGT